MWKSAKKRAPYGARNGAAPIGARLHLLPVFSSIFLDILFQMLSVGLLKFLFEYSQENFKRDPPPHPFRNQLTDECFYMKKKFWFKSMSPKANTYIYAYSQKVKTMFTYFIDLAESLKPFSLPLSSGSKCMRLFLLQMHWFESWWRTESTRSPPPGSLSTPHMSRYQGGHDSCFKCIHHVKYTEIIYLYY